MDAMGHGLEASRMANVAVASYRSSRRAGADPAGSLVAMDEVIRSEFGDSRFVTAQAATLDLDSGRMQIANAGHPQPLLLRRHAAPSRITGPASDRMSTRLNSSHSCASRMPSSDCTKRNKFLLYYILCT